VFRSNLLEPHGGDRITQFGRELYELNIISCANSATAKGRIARANLTLQNRWLKKRRLREFDRC
jgi:hypothetical protein